MSVLMKFKKWVLLDEAAEYLSRELGEDITQADLLRLTLDGHLYLSVYFSNHAYGRPGKVVPYIEAVTKELSLPPLMSPGEKIVVLKGTMISQDEGVIELDEVDTVERLSGIFDIPTWAARHGATSLDIEEQFLSLIDGPSLELISLSGVFVTDKDGTVYQILDRFDRDSPADKETTKRPWDNIKSFYPAASFPKGSMFVIRTTELHRLEKELSAESKGSASAKESPKKEAISTDESPDYSTRLLAIQAEAIEKFWVNYDPSEPDTAPDKKAILAWLTKQKGCTDAAARAIDLIIRHDRAKRGGARPRG